MTQQAAAANQKSLLEEYAAEVTPRPASSPPRSAR